MYQIIKAVIMIYWTLMGIFMLLNPEFYGQWSARAELAFTVKADQIGLWTE